MSRESRPIPIALLLRVFGARDLIRANSAFWTDDDHLTVEVDGRAVVLTHLSREELLAHYGEAIAEATHGWRLPERLILCQPNGGTIQWRHDPAALDTAASGLVDYLERRQQAGSTRPPAP